MQPQVRPCRVPSRACPAVWLTGWGPACHVIVGAGTSSSSKRCTTASATYTSCWSSTCLPLASIGHVLSAGLTPAFRWVAPASVDGGELFDKIIESGTFPEPDAKALFRQIAKAIAYLHKQNISHRYAAACLSCALTCEAGDAPPHT